VFQSRGSIDAFREELPATVVRDIESWRDRPELAALHAALHAHTDQRTFLNTWAEALVARHLLKRGCGLRFEVPTPTGRRADFEVLCPVEGDAGGDEVRFFLHVKRIDTGAAASARLTVSSRLRVLERIARPYIVSIRWHEGLSDRQMQRLVREAETFILQARVGDELTVRDGHPRRAGEEIGGLRILAPWAGPNVTLAIGMPAGFTDEASRMRKLLRKAYQQFMPRGANVIVLGTSHEKDAGEFENALLGSHIERWDEFPPPGRRIAHGRDVDGFWFGQRFVESRAAGWFRFSLKETSLRSRLWIREGTLAETPLYRALRALFEA
jgi:hypothetical protein